MRYRVTFRKRFNKEGEGWDEPQTMLNLADGVVAHAAMVEQIDPESLHTYEDKMDEDDDFFAFGTEIWDFDIAPGREQEFKFEAANSEIVMELEETESAAESAAGGTHGV